MFSESSARAHTHTHTHTHTHIYINYVYETKIVQISTKRKPYRQNSYTHISQKIIQPDNPYFKPKIGKEILSIIQCDDCSDTTY